MRSAPGSYNSTMATPRVIYWGVFATAVLGTGVLWNQGGALLLDNDLPEHNAVMLSDLDLLVRADEVQRAITSAPTYQITIFRDGENLVSRVAWAEGRRTKN